MHQRPRWRIKARPAAVLALATAGALVMASGVLAAGHSTVAMDFSPGALAPPGTGYTSGKLSIHTHTSYTYPGAHPGGATQRGQLYFDDDLRVNTNAVPKCAPSSIDGNDVTLQQAMAACGSSLVGTGTVKAIAPDNPNFAGDQSFFVNGCLRVFNGQGSASEILMFVRSQLSNPSNINCATNGVQGNFSDMLPADLTANPASAGADYADPDNCSAPTRLGCQLDLNNIPAVTPFPLADFNVAFQQGSFVAARCDDNPQQLNLRTTFTYTDGGMQTVNASKACT